MIDESPTTALVIRLATLQDLEQIAHLDSFSTSPTRDIHRDMEKYFGSIDPSTHEHTFIFLAEEDGVALGKAELMLPPAESPLAIGYVKRVVVHPQARGKGIARHLIEHIIRFAHEEHGLEAVDLHVWDQNHAAIHLYESLGFTLQHRELYYRLTLG